jgi:hypothetical protein
MSSSQHQALAEARKLVRTFTSAPDARRRAQAVMSELRHAEAWSVAAQGEIDAVETWLRIAPSASTLEARLRALLAALGEP